MNEYQSGGARDKNNDLKLFPLRNEDLVFSKNSDGVLSCGYKVSNALLNATLGMPMVGGGGGGGGGNTSPKKEHGKNKKNDNDTKTAKLMEDLVIPSSLYYGKPVSNTKVFNYKKGKRDKDKKGRDSSSDNESDDDVIEESLYDKLLSLVSLDNKVKYDKKTRKHTDGRSKVNIKKDGKNANGEEIDININKNKNKHKHKKTKKVRFNL
jgi:hypothetical protein